MIEGFHSFVIFSIRDSKIDWILFSNAKETSQKMLARKCESSKLPNFFFAIRLSMYWQNIFVKIFLKTGFVGTDL